MDAKDYRKLNALLLAQEVGSLSALAKLAGTAQSYLSQIIGPKGQRDMGDDLARRLEFVCKKPHGWMDAPHIDDERQQKARAVYESLLRLPDNIVDAFVALAVAGGARSSEDLGRVNVESFAQVEQKDRVTKLGTVNVESRATKTPKRGAPAKRGKP